MTAKQKSYLVIGFIAVVILLAILFRNCESPTIVTKPVDSVFYWKDKYNNTVASLKGKEEQFGYKEKMLLDSIAKIHHVKPDRIKEYVTVYQKGQAVITTIEKPVITYVDSGKGKEIKSVFQMFESPYYLAEATIDLSGDSSRLALQTIDTLSIVWKEVREGKFLRKKNYLQLDVTNKNPYNYIVGVEAYRVPLPKPKKFGIGIVAGYGLGNNFQATPIVGVGVSYNLIRF